MIRSSLDTKTIEFESKSDSIQEVCGQMSFFEYQTHAEREVETHRTTVSSMTSALSMYTKFIEKFQESQCCPLCVRGFSTPQEGSAFKGKLQGILERVPTASAAATRDLGKWTGILTRLRELQSAQDDCDRLSKIEIPDLKSKRDSMSRDRSGLLGTIEDV